MATGHLLQVTPPSPARSLTSWGLQDETLFGGLSQAAQSMKNGHSVSENGSEK